MSVTQFPSRTHNNPPVVAPTPEDMSEDLKGRFPELDARLNEFEKALATYPADLTLKDEDIASNLQDLLGQMKKFRTLIGAHKKDEKKPWDALVKVVQNFFAKHDERTEVLLLKWQPIHEAFLTLKKDDARRLAEEEAERQRKIEEDNRARAEAAERERKEAEARAADQRRIEEENRQAAERAKKEREEAEARAELARAEERRLADAKRERDKAERDQNAVNLREVRRLMKEAENLHERAEVEGDEADELELKELDAMIRAGGTIGEVAAVVVHSSLLDDEQKAAIEAVRTRLGELREAMNSRYNAKERKRREKERKESEAREAVIAEQRRKEQAEHAALLAEATRKRQEEEAAAEAANAEKKAAEAAARTARAEIKDATKDIKDASKNIKASSQEAARAGNRADRVEHRLESGESGGPLRGDLGTTGSLTGSWKYYVTDEAALRAVSGPLGEHFTAEALSGAAYRWMCAHREGFTGERVEGALPGVVFAWETTSRIA